MSKQDQIRASIVSTLLMDGMDGRGQVAVIGATNRPDAVDPASCPSDSNLLSTSSTAQEVQDWVTALEDARHTLLAISTINSVSTPIPIPQAKGSGSQGPFPPSSSPSAHAAWPFTSSELEDAMPTIYQRTQPTTSSSKQGSLSMAPSKSTAPPNDPTKVILGRFDREFYFGLPVFDAREKILTIMSHD